MQERLDIRSMIHEGDIERAMAKVNEINPKVNDGNKTSVGISDIKLC